MPDLCRILLAVVLLLCPLYPRICENGEITPAVRNTCAAPGTDRLTMIILFREADFFCPSCLEPLLAFCRDLAREHVSCPTWGILVTGPVEGNSDQREKTARVLTKRLKVFGRVNQLNFPILIDRAGAFERPADEGIRILIFDGRENSPIALRLPLDRGNWADILRRVRRRPMN